MSAEILKSITDAVILNTILKEDSYAYKISSTINQITNNQINIKNATIYLAFKKLEKDKLITSYWQNNPTGTERKYYKITSKGKNYLKEKQNYWLNTRQIIDNLLIGADYERKV